MLQSPAPALIKMDPPLSDPSMKARSLMVPSCMLNSRSGPKTEVWRLLKVFPKWMCFNLYLTRAVISKSQTHKCYLWHCSCLHWRAGPSQIYHWSQWPAVVHSGSRPHSRLNPCGVCSSWSALLPVWLHHSHLTEQKQKTEANSETIRDRKGFKMQCCNECRGNCCIQYDDITTDIIKWTFSVFYPQTICLSSPANRINRMQLNILYIML